MGDSPRARTRIDREAWGPTWNVGLEAGGWLVGKHITIDLEIAAIEQAAGRGRQPSRLSGQDANGGAMMTRATDSIPAAPRSGQRSIERVRTEPHDASPTRDHAHHWRGLEFFFRDEHPWFRMACQCGAERVIRAWERYWDPGGEGA